jgi:teichuronic acid biosynthesis glycosyltransferase TuaH
MLNVSMASPTPGQGTGVHAGGGSRTRYAIVALAPQEWDGQWVNRQQLLSRIGRDHEVLYSTGGWFLWDRATPEWRGARVFGRMRRADNVWIDESPRYLMRWPRARPIDRLVMRRQARRWLAWAARNARGPLVAQVCHPSFAPYVDLLKPDYLVYHVYDLYDHMPGWRSEWADLEHELLRRADLVFCVSEPLAGALRRKVSRKVEVLANGADVDAFLSGAACGTNEPPDLTRIPRPRIGWTGSLHPQIDFGLVAKLAQRRPEWQFVFVGNKVSYTEERAEREYRECERLPNVHFLGYKHRSEVPAYVLNMDVNMMCYRLAEDRWTKAIHPLKLYEYLAAGRPVVSVDLEVLRSTADVIRFAAGPGEWDEAIEEALVRGGAGTPERRVAVARDNSWDARATVLEQWLLRLHDRDGLPAGVSAPHPPHSTYACSGR